MVLLSLYQKKSISTSLLQPTRLLIKVYFYCASFILH